MIQFSNIWFVSVIALWLFNYTTSLSLEYNIWHDLLKYTGILIWYYFNIMVKIFLSKSLSVLLIIGHFLKAFSCHSIDFHEKSFFISPYGHKICPMAPVRKKVTPSEVRLPQAPSWKWVWILKRPILFFFLEFILQWKVSDKGNPL